MKKAVSAKKIKKAVRKLVNLRKNGPLTLCDATRNNLGMKRATAPPWMGKGKRTCWCTLREGRKMGWEKFYETVRRGVCALLLKKKVSTPPPRKESEERGIDYRRSVIKKRHVSNNDAAMWTGATGRRTAIPRGHP